jgi:integrase/recombinase XerD
MRRESRVTMMWSTTGMPRSLPAAISFAVVAMSSGDGYEHRSKAPLFQSAPGRSATLSGRAMKPGKVWEAVKRRCKAAGLPSSISNHSFRATGITLHQENGGRLEDAQAHADARTTRLYVRKERKLAQAEVERVQL